MRRIGGQNDQNLADAGSEGNLDVQFAFGLAYPTPGVFYSTGGRAPFVPDARMPSDSSNEPFIQVRAGCDRQNRYPDYHSVLS